jgi:hypothetical protein
MPLPAKAKGKRQKAKIEHSNAINNILYNIILTSLNRWRPHQIIRIIYLYFNF